MLTFRRIARPTFPGAACLAALLIAPGLAGPAPAAAAGPPKTGFVNKTFKDADGTTTPYAVFVPHSYDGSKPVPVILYLGGSGEAKGAGTQPGHGGIGLAIRKREKTFPCLTVFPQRREPLANAGDEKRAMAVLAAVLKDYKTDPNRVYLTGLSSGGFETWDLAAAYPNRWAAIVPLCGGGDPKSAPRFKHVPCWCFHGEKDNTVKVENSRAMIAALKAAGGKPRYTEYKGVGHNCWDKAYATDELYTWLLKQKRKGK